MVFVLQSTDAASDGGSEGTVGWLTLSEAGKPRGRVALKLGVSRPWALFL